MEPFYILIIKASVIGFTLRIALLASALSDILLILTRLLNLFNKKNFLTKIPKKYNLLGCYVLSSCFLIPVYFTIKFIPTTSTGMYYLSPNEFGTSFAFRVYWLSVLIIESVIPFLCLLILNVISIIKFRKVMANKVHLALKKSRAVEAEERFTKYTLVLTLVCLLTLTLDMFTSIVHRFYNLRFIFYTPEQAAWLLLFKQIAYFCLFTSHEKSKI